MVRLLLSLPDPDAGADLRGELGLGIILPPEPPPSVVDRAQGGSPPVRFASRLVLFVGSSGGKCLVANLMGFVPSNLSGARLLSSRLMLASLCFFRSYIATLIQ